MRVPGIPYVQGRNDYTDGDARKYGIAIHNTSNDASDEGEASYATWRPDGVSSHFYVDHNSVTQSIDTYDRAGHAGSTHGNDHGISVEITGGNGKSRAWWLANVAWDELGRVLAIVIRHHWPDGRFEVRRASVAEMRRNPKVRAFYGHNDMRLAWGGTTHTDPGPNFPWDRLFEAVSEHLTEEDDMPYSDWPKADRKALAADVADAVVNKGIPYPGSSKANIRVRTGIAYGMFYGGATRGGVAELAAQMAALDAKLGGEDPGPRIRAELDRHRGLLLAELGDTLADAVQAELGEVPEEVTAAVNRALDRIRVVVEPASDNDGG